LCGGGNEKGMTRYPVPAATAQSPHCTQLVLRRSRFLTQCARAQGVEEARAFVDMVRRNNPDATHNCWAYVAGPPGDTAHIGSSDDGEPHGTAGRPMLQVLLHCGTGEICTVVSRWFGGVKLGTGGLVRAYQDAVRDNLANLALTEQRPLVHFTAEIEYAHLDGLRRSLPRFEAKIAGQRCEDCISLDITLPKEHFSGFTQSLATLTNGTARFSR
jgi:uncharacterized YigZ family protein